MSCERSSPSAAVLVSSLLTRERAGHAFDRQGWQRISRAGRDGGGVRALDASDARKHFRLAGERQAVAAGADGHALWLGLHHVAHRVTYGEWKNWKLHRVRRVAVCDDDDGLTARKSVHRIGDKELDLIGEGNVALTSNSNRFLNKKIKRRIPVEVREQRFAVHWVISAREGLLRAIINAVSDEGNQKTKGFSMWKKVTFN